MRETEDAIVANGTVTAVRELLTQRLAVDKAAAAKARKALAAAEAKREDARKLVAGARPDGAKKFTITVKIELLSPSADPRHGYRLRPTHNAFRDDEHKFKVTNAGLLTNVNIVATDRTSDIITEVATFVGALTTSIPASGDRLAIPAKPCGPAPQELTSLVDFADPNSVAELNADLACIGVRLNPVAQPAPAQPVTYATAPVDGLVYRTPLDVIVRVEKCSLPEGNCSPSTGWYTTELIALSLPQAGPISYVRQDAGFMTRTSYAVAFQDGVLVEYNAQRPSEFLEVARTPMRIVNGLFDGASKIISLRTGQNTARTGLSASELALVEARYSLAVGTLTGDKKLSDAELALLRSQSALVIGPIDAASNLSAAELQLLRARLASTQGANTAATELSASELALMLAVLRDQARRESVNKCIGEQVAKAEPIDACLTGK